MMVFTKQARKNKRGVTYAPGQDKDGTYSVWKLCENYDGKVRGGISKTWRYCEKGLTLDQAKSLFEKKIGAKLY